MFRPSLSLLALCGLLGWSTKAFLTNMALNLKSIPLKNIVQMSFLPYFQLCIKLASKVALLPPLFCLIHTKYMLNEKILQRLSSKNSKIHGNSLKRSPPRQTKPAWSVEIRDTFCFQPKRWMREEGCLQRQKSGWLSRSLSEAPSQSCLQCQAGTPSCSAITSQFLWIACLLPPVSAWIQKSCCLKTWSRTSPHSDLPHQRVSTYCLQSCALRRQRLHANVWIHHDS